MINFKPLLPPKDQKKVDEILEIINIAEDTKAIIFVVKDRSSIPPGVGQEISNYLKIPCLAVYEGYDTKPFKKEELDHLIDKLTVIRDSNP